MLDQLKKNWALLTLIFTILGAGYAGRGVIEKLTKPVEGINETLKRLEKSQSVMILTVDSLGNWSEMRFQANEIELALIKQAIANNRELMTMLANLRSQVRENDQELNLLLERESIPVIEPVNSRGR